MNIDKITATSKRAVAKIAKYSNNTKVPKSPSRGGSTTNGATIESNKAPI
eukprot:CAMPEP_0114051690 /NCGR_PEP_ID=MMETSP1339-20121228/71308_1 /TAXON_ID=94617 /ORGANISM="Fibrocapsa japonica" /LENGTH=49 /assembly_acc=CAM_ASM_000762